MGHGSGQAATQTLIGALGPTNTGKTHRAIERMLQHDSGMIGLPLRLLAREVYDRIASRLGQEAVALVTGEERRIPRMPSYWVCTVEAMPLSQRVDFLAIDEVQLAANPQRGHVFTDRVLHARGLKETWFLGADTMRPLLSTFVPGIRFESCMRFSQLRHAGEHSLRSLPARSAVVAFSTHEVYALAERLRRLRGGVAVVLGALSPRTRNAQVAMFQAGEVQYLVATDAIGMGLNLDVNHVAFSTLSKFDGRQQRRLYPEELAQIAGRAGRHIKDGTFGTLKKTQQLSEQTIAAIEEHRFPAQQRLIYRNASLDFSSLSALSESLCAPAPHPALRRVEQADDFAVLQCLAGIDEVRQLCGTEAAVQLLWDVCQVPNFSKQLPNHHASALLPVFRELSQQGMLDAARFETQVSGLDRADGDIPTLTARLESIRTYCYLSHRAGWLEDEERFQERTRAAEERLGDALHAQLVERFVSRETRPRRRRAVQADNAAPAISTGPFAQLQSLREQLPDDDSEDESAFLARVEKATMGSFIVDGHGVVRFEGEALGRLVAGKEVRLPEMAVSEPELWSAGARTRLLQRLRALSRDLVAEASGGAAHLLARFQEPAARGLSYALEQGLGILPRSEGSALFQPLGPASQGKFVALGLRTGRKTVHLQGALSSDALRLRLLLAHLHRPSPLSPNGLHGLRNSFQDLNHVLLCGHVALGGITLRVDIFEAASAAAARGGDAALTRLLEPLDLPSAVNTALFSALRRRPASPTGEPSEAPKRRRRRRRRTAATRESPADGKQPPPGDSG